MGRLELTTTVATCRRAANDLIRGVGACALILGLGVVPMLSAEQAHAAVVEVNSIDAAFMAPGQWFENDVRAAGTASIQDLTGLGGNLETAAPLPTGAARLTTGFDNNDKAEIGVVPVFGGASTKAGDILADATFTLEYSFHKAAVAGGNAFAAPAIKLTFFSSTFAGDGFGTLVYEPTWNQPGNLGSSVAVPTDQWTNVTIDLNNGLFWWTGGFGQPNTAGGPPLRTLSDWGGEFDPGFSDADLVLLSVGVGTFNQGQNGYFDNVGITRAGQTTTYDFQAATAVPEPSSALLFGIGLIGLGMLLRRRRLAA